MKNNIQEYITKSLEETQMVARDFAKNLDGGDVVALYGDLGAGKTTFVQGVSKEMGIEKRIVSPTFILMRQYELPDKKLYHLDLYRLETKKDMEGIGIEEIMNNKKNIVLIEWAEKMKGLLPEKRWEVWFEYIDHNSRKITIKPPAY